ncbi:hypothetical protein Vretimale_19188, partial [Volvox reticuliferus]
LADDPVLWELSRLTDDLLVPDRLMAVARSLRDVSNATINFSRPESGDEERERGGLATAAGATTATRAGGGGNGGVGGSGSSLGASRVTVSGSSGGGVPATGQSWRRQELSRRQLMTLLKALTTTPPLSETERPGVG